MAAVAAVVLNSKARHLTTVTSYSKSSVSLYSEIDMVQVDKRYPNQDLLILSWTKYRRLENCDVFFSVTATLLSFLFDSELDNYFHL